MDESKRRGVSYENSGKLKNKITEPTCTVTYKGEDPFDIRSCHRFIYCVNWLDAVDIELFDQRFCVIECSAQLRGQKEVFEQFDVQDILNMMYLKMLQMPNIYQLNHILF